MADADKMFLVEKGQYVVIRDEAGTEVGFGSFADFEKYCPIGEFNVDLTGKVYIDYEPHASRNIYIDSEVPAITNADIPNALYDGLISNVDVIKSRVDDPFYGLSLAEAKTLKKDQLRSEANAIIIAKWPVYTQLNINAGIVGTGDKTEKDTDVVSVRDVCNTEEANVDAAADINAVKAITASWPSI